MFLEDIHWVAAALLIFAVLVFLLATGMPIAFAMISLGILGFLFLKGWDDTFTFVSAKTWESVNAKTFIAFPLFAILVEILTQSGLSAKMIDVAQKTMGRVPGGLAVVCVGASTIFGAVCGSSLVGTLIMTDTLLPETMKRGYDKSLIAGIIAAAGNLSALIPPSFVLIFWAILCGQAGSDVSIGDLFMAGIIPGVLIAAMFTGYIVIRAIRNPEIAPPAPKVPIKEGALSILKAWDLIIVIGVLLGGIYFGVATLNEIAGVTAAAAFLLALVQRRLTIFKVNTALRKSVELIAAILLIIVGTAIFNIFLSALMIPQSLAEWVVDADLSPVLLVIAVQVLFFILGMFIDPMSVMFICLPLFLKSLIAADVDLIWLGVVITISTMIANLTPPVGFNLFVVHGAGAPYGLKLTDVVRGAIPFLIMMLIGMALVIAIPSLATWLPSLAG